MFYTHHKLFFSSETFETNVGIIEIRKRRPRDDTMHHARRFVAAEKFVRSTIGHGHLDSGALPALLRMVLVLENHRVSDLLRNEGVEFHVFQQRLHGLFGQGDLLVGRRVHSRTSERRSARQVRKRRRRRQSGDGDGRRRDDPTFRQGRAVHPESLHADGQGGGADVRVDRHAGRSFRRAAGRATKGSLLTFFEKILCFCEAEVDSTKNRRK